MVSSFTPCRTKAAKLIPDPCSDSIFELPRPLEEDEPTGASQHKPEDTEAGEDAETLFKDAAKILLSTCVWMVGKHSFQIQYEILFTLRNFKKIVAGSRALEEIGARPTNPSWEAARSGWTSIYGVTWGCLVGTSLSSKLPQAPAFLAGGPSSGTLGCGSVSAFRNLASKRNKCTLNYLYLLYLHLGN